RRGSGPRCSITNAHAVRSSRRHLAAGLAPAREQAPRLNQCLVPARLFKNRSDEIPKSSGGERRLCLRMAVFVEKGVDSLRGPACACVKLAGATQSIKSFRPKRLRRVHGCACPKSAIQELSTG